jgi:hypothetical protein
VIPVKIPSSAGDYNFLEIILEMKLRHLNRHKYITICFI